MQPPKNSRMKSHAGISAPSADPRWAAHFSASASRGKKTLHATERDSPRVQKERRRFLRNVKKLPARKFIFLDEFGTNLGMTRRYARARRGQRAVGAVPANPDPNITLVMGLSHQGVVAPSI